MNLNKGNAMARLRAATPKDVLDPSALLSESEMDQLFSAIPIHRSDDAKRRHWSSLPGRTRTGILVLALGLVGAGGGFAAASTLAGTNATSPPNPVYSKAQRESIYSNTLKLARCLHEHGFPAYPNPNPNYGNGKTPPPDVGGGDGIDVTSPAFITARQDCTVGTQAVPGVGGLSSATPITLSDASGTTVTGRISKHDIVGGKIDWAKVPAYIPIYQGTTFIGLVKKAQVDHPQIVFGPLIKTIHPPGEGVTPQVIEQCASSGVVDVYNRSHILVGHIFPGTGFVPVGSSTCKS